MSWVTREVKIQEYGWVVNMRDATLRELTALREAGSDMDKVLEVVARLITGWNITTPNGQPIDVTASSLKDIPNQAIAELLNPVFKRAAGISDPKGGSESMPTMPPEPGVSKQTAPH